MAPKVRGAGAKVSHVAARMLRAGHPWVFRESLLRPVSGVEPGAVVPVADEDGYAIGSGLVEGEGAIAMRMVSFDPKFRFDPEQIQQRVHAAAEYRRRHVESAISGACRVIHGEADGLPGIAVDRLGDFLLVYRYSWAAESFISPLVAALEQEFRPKGIYLQHRVKGVTPGDRRPAATHVAGEVAPPEYEVEEDGLRFLVDVSAPVSPGLFLDLREGRRLCERLARDRRMLNLFAYTGSFGLRGIRGGAREVTNVDSAARAHARCRQNLAASGMDAEACEPVTGDVFKHLEKLRQKRRAFDLVVVDPPPFSKVGGKVFSALQHWRELMEGVARVLAPDGLVLAISNASGLSEQEFLLAIGEGGKAAERTPRIVAELGLPVDFPTLPAFEEGRYLKIKLLHVP